MSGRQFNPYHFMRNHDAKKSQCCVERWSERRQGQHFGPRVEFCRIRPYSFTTRFENAPGTNPEELIAAAHAACFSMALSAQLGGANLTPESINTNVTLSSISWTPAGRSRLAISTSLAASLARMQPLFRNLRKPRRKDARYRKY